MRDLSISTAWDETKAIVARDGRLFLSVALALVALPAALTGAMRPNGMAGASAPIWVELVLIATSLVALAGQLALIRLALGPSTTVGSAIGHGFARMPIYLLAAILIVIVLLVLAIPFVIALTALGVPLDRQPIPSSPQLFLIVFLYFLLAFAAGVKMSMSAPVASAEGAGPIAIIKRSWELTAGHFWTLFGFLLAFVVAAVIALIAVGAAVGVVVTLLLGAIEPMSGSALVVGLVQGLINAVVTTLFAVMLARIYVQLSGRGEVGVPSSGI